jgi:hypothetical protein
MYRLPGLIAMLLVSCLLAFACTSGRAQIPNPNVTQTK